MRAVDPNVALPYWDSTLDSNIPNPAESVLWAEELVGGTDGSGWIISGAFAGWRTADGGALNRRLGADREARLFRDSDINYLMSQTGTEKFLAFTTPQCTTDFTELEYTHDQIHKYIGGHMGEQRFRLTIRYSFCTMRSLTLSGSFGDSNDKLRMNSD
ncbi:CBN-TYR-4 protein [Aphelenchoides avenae]|nr:CBN-TYR-4 protein [Aphelenchus avenae]